jgi:hypothetical protein
LLCRWQDASLEFGNVGLALGNLQRPLRDNQLFERRSFGLKLKVSIPTVVVFGLKLQFRNLNFKPVWFEIAVWSKLQFEIAVCDFVLKSQFDLKLQFKIEVCDFWFETAVVDFGLKLKVVIPMFVMTT